MPVLVVKFPEDKGKKVNMSRFLSKYIKREFSVIVAVAEEDVSHIFKVLNRNQCKVIIAKDRSIQIDFETYFLLYLFTHKFKKEQIGTPKNGEILDYDLEKDEEERFYEYTNEVIFQTLKNDKKLTKMFVRYKKNTKRFTDIFEKDFIISRDKKLFFDWDYRVRVLFDTIRISVLDLTKEIEKLEKTEDLNMLLKIMLAIDSGNHTLGEIADFIGEENVDELDELIKLKIVRRNPYRLSKHGKYIINKVIKESLKEKLTYKLHSIKEKILEDLRNTEYARIMSNLLITLSLLAIKNRIVIDEMEYDKFQDIIFYPISKSDEND